MTSHIKEKYLLAIFYSAIFAVITFFYSQKIFAFGCFDDCSNFIGGYFLLKGKEIYTDFFFNHAPMMPLLSFLIQKVLDPPGVYEFIFYHRISLYIFSYFFGLFLIFRFQRVAFFTLIIFESIKFFIFGDRFLAEGFIIYPLIYLFGIGLLKISKVKIHNWEFIFSAILVWIISLTREPYIPLALFLFICILLGKLTRPKIFAVLLFLGLSLLSFVVLPINNMIQNIYTFNNAITTSEIHEKGGYLKILFYSFFYPIYIFIDGKESILRITEYILSFTFIGLAIKSILEKRFLLILFVLISLLLSNIRYTTPGLMYYSAFHMIVWFGLFIFSINFLIFNLKISKNIKFLIIALVLIIPLISVFSNDSYTQRTTSKIDDLNREYGSYYTYAAGIKNLSNPSSTMFLEEQDDSIYFFAGVPSSYKFGWYTAHMPQIKKYKDERDLMFVKTPPDFYYDACLITKRKQKDPRNYTRIILNSGPSCLLIKTENLKSIPDEKWESIKSLGFVEP